MNQKVDMWTEHIYHTHEVLIQTLVFQFLSLLFLSRVQGQETHFLVFVPLDHIYLMEIPPVLGSGRNLGRVLAMETARADLE